MKLAFVQVSTEYSLMDGKYIVAQQQPSILGCYLVSSCTKVYAMHYLSEPYVK